MSYPSCQTKELKGLTVKQLQSLAKREGLTGYTKLKKDELCREIAKRLSAKGKSAPKSAMKKSSGDSKKSVRFADAQGKKRLIAVSHFGDYNTLQIVAPDGFYPGDSAEKFRRTMFIHMAGRKPDDCTLCFDVQDDLISALYELMDKTQTKYSWLSMDSDTFIERGFPETLTGDDRALLQMYQNARSKKK